MPARRLRALVYEDDAATRRAVGVIADRCGFDVVGEVESAADAVLAAELSRPDAIVVDLALTGVLGLGILRTLQVAAPECAIVVLSSFETMRRPALQAGAYEFVGNSDLRRLERCLRRVAREAALRVEAGGNGTGPDAHGVPAATSPSLPLLAGSRSTNAPFS